MISLKVQDNTGRFTGFYKSNKAIDVECFLKYLKAIKEDEKLDDFKTCYWTKKTKKDCVKLGIADVFLQSGVIETIGKTYFFDLKADGRKLKKYIKI